MYSNYMDDPNGFESWIETLTDKEQLSFSQGYILALHGVLESIVDTKRKLLHTMMINASRKVKHDCEARVAILDALERHYRQRVNNLESQETNP